MGVYDEMKSCLQKTGLYRLDGNTAVDFELQAYAAGLEPMCDTLKQLKAESFVATASNYGLWLKESASGIASSTGETDSRRKVLYAAGSVMPGSCTKAGLENLLDAFGFDANVLEDTADKKVTVQVKKSPDGQNDKWEKIIGQLIPAQLSVVWEYS